MFELAGKQGEFADQFLGACRIENAADFSQMQGEEVKLYYASQVAVAPPIFALVSNRPDDLAEHYQRYLIKGFREAWDFAGVPIRLRINARKSQRS